MEVHSRSGTRPRALFVAAVLLELINQSIDRSTGRPRAINRFGNTTAGRSMDSVVERDRDGFRLVGSGGRLIDRSIDRGWPRGTTDPPINPLHRVLELERGHSHATFDSLIEHSY